MQLYNHLLIVHYFIRMWLISACHIAPFIESSLVKKEGGPMVACRLHITLQPQAPVCFMWHMYSNVLESAMIKQ
jgi:hypothetical protein